MGTLQKSQKYHKKSTKFLWKVAPEVASAERERLGSEARGSRKKGCSVDGVGGW